MEERIKIGFSDIGGIYIGKKFSTVPHLHYANTLAISMSENFEFILNGVKTNCSNILVKYNSHRQFLNPNQTQVAFVHIEPFCDESMTFSLAGSGLRFLSESQENKLRSILDSWYQNPINDEKVTYEAIQKTISEISEKTAPRKIDKRIWTAINHIRQTESYTLTDIADTVNLSAYRLSHLFKKETEISFREYVLYQKLVKSLKAIHKKNSLTQSSHIGGFADQAHFTRTYYKAFGILPSQSIK